MNSLGHFLVEIGITLLVCSLAIAYLRPVMMKILTDLCGTEERAKFWTTFSCILLLSLPLIASLGFSPSPNTGSNGVYEIAHQLKNNLINFVLGLVLIGFVFLFFTASAPKTRYQDK